MTINWISVDERLPSSDLWGKWVWTYDKNTGWPDTEFGNSIIEGFSSATHWAEITPPEDEHDS